MDENANCPRRGSGLTSGPSIRIGQLTAAWSSNSRGSEALLVSTNAYLKHVDTHTHT